MMPPPPNRPRPLEWQIILTTPKTTWQGPPQKWHHHPDIQKWSKETRTNISKQANHRILRVLWADWLRDVCWMWAFYSVAEEPPPHLPLHLLPHLLTPWRWTEIYTDTCIIYKHRSSVRDRCFTLILSCQHWLLKTKCHSFFSGGEFSFLSIPCLLAVYLDVPGSHSP